MLRVVLATIALSAGLTVPAPGQTAGAPAERARAWEALRSKLKEQRYLSHSLAVEAMVREMAVPGTDDVDQWGLAGLLHDVDIGETSGDLSKHGTVGARYLRDQGFDAAAVHAVLAHDDRSGVARTSRLDHAVFCADQVYWLVSGTGHGVPSDKLNAANPETVWELAQAVPSKKAVLPQVTRECGEIGLSMPRAMAAAQAASKKLTQAAGQ